MLTQADSLSIRLSNAETIIYHSDALGFDITYPSYLQHQRLDDPQMEVFLSDDLSLSFMVMDTEHVSDDVVLRTPGMTMHGMGAELLEAGDDYSIHTGQEGELEYYTKILEDGPRIITVMLRYLPGEAEAVEDLRQMVHDFRPVNSEDATNETTTKTINNKH
ncbi:MAG: hypothetical protein IJ527_00375 [Prevotella sp.]|nr:hypothetical protein [Prevotella sp.]